MAIVEKVKVNDIVLVFKKNRFFVHRLIHKRGKTIVTRGDHNLSSDGQFRERNLLGKVVGVKRGNNRINIENMNLIQSTLYFAEAVKISGKFQKKGIKMIILKGLPLHLFIEGTHPKRLYADTVGRIPV